MYARGVCACVQEYLADFKFCKWETCSDKRYAVWKHFLKGGVNLHVVCISLSGIAVSHDSLETISVIH